MTYMYTYNLLQDNVRS